VADQPVQNRITAIDAQAKQLADADAARLPLLFRLTS